MFAIFSYKNPIGFKLEEKNEKLFFQKNEGKDYCQLILYPAVTSLGDAEKDFKKYWDFFALNKALGVDAPETKDIGSLLRFKMLFGAARGKYHKQPFVVTVSVFTKNDIINRLVI